MISYSGTQLDSLTKVSGIPKSEIGTLSGIDITALEDSPFITEWETTTANESITLPLVSYAGAVFNCVVSWGDGTQSTITSHDDADRIHTYVLAGIYSVSITGACESWSFITVTTSRLKIKKILSFGSGALFTGFKNLYGGFYGCSNLTSIGTTRIKPNGLQYIDGVFSQCASLLFVDKNTFILCTDVISISSCFAACSSLTSIPSGMFDTLTKVTIAVGCFVDCTNITSIPTGLFRNQRKCDAFNQTFYGMTKAQFNKYIFYNEGEQGTRFMDVQFMDGFLQTFYRTSFSGIQGEAPDLWNCTFNQTPTKTSCFGGGGNNSTSLSNYDSIPTEWKT